MFLTRSTKNTYLFKRHPTLTEGTVSFAQH